MGRIEEGITKNMAIPANLKTLLMRCEKHFCQVFGVNAYRKLRGISNSSDTTLDEILLIVDLLLPEKRKGLMVDVGAHHGESFRFFAFSGWDVIAFEPDPSPRKHAMIRARSTSRVRELRCAVSDRAGQSVPFYISTESTGVSSLTPFLESHKAAGEVVITDTLANCLAEHARGARVDFLKIDTEGHDLFVLKGIDWSQPNQCPRTIICEFEDRKTKPLGYDFREMAEFLAAKGYVVWVSEWLPITKYGARHTWRSLKKWPCSLADSDGWGNLLAVEQPLSKRAEQEWNRFSAVSKGGV